MKFNETNHIQPNCELHKRRLCPGYFNRNQLWEILRIYVTEYVKVIALHLSYHSTVRIMDLCQIGQNKALSLFSLKGKRRFSKHISTYSFTFIFLSVTETLRCCVIPTRQKTWNSDSAPRKT